MDAKLGDVLIVLSLACPFEILICSNEELKVDQLCQRLICLVHQLLDLHDLFEHLDNAAHLGFLSLQQCTSIWTAKFLSCLP